MTISTYTVTELDALIKDAQRYRKLKESLLGSCEHSEHVRDMVSSTAHWTFSEGFDAAVDALPDVAK